MTWAKLDDKYPRHTKMLMAGAEGLALDVAGICYSSERGTDGFVPDDAIAVLFPVLKNPLKSAEKLVTVGRWERDDLRGGWWIHDYLEYNPSASDRQEQSERASAAAKKKWDAKRMRDALPDASEPQCEGIATHAGPVPSRPDSSSSSSSSPLLEPPDDDDRFGLACYVLTFRTLEAEREAGRGPTGNVPKWLASVYEGKRREHAERGSHPDVWAFTDEEFADYLEPPAKPKSHPLDSIAAAARRREDDADQKRKEEAKSFVAPAERPDFREMKQGIYKPSEGATA